MTWMTSIYVAVLFLVLISVLLRARRRRSMLLGAELAQAEAVQDAHGGVPILRAYDAPAGEADLWDPPPSPTDDVVRELVGQFAAGDEAARIGLRDNLHMHDFYTLLTFVYRASVFALRSRDRTFIEDALTAISILASNRIDPRDVLVAMGMVYHAASRLSLDPAPLFRAAARHADPIIGRFLTDFDARPTKDKDLRSAWGHDEIVTRNGIGLVQHGGGRHQPSPELVQIALAITKVLDASDYKTSSITIAEKCPSNWFNPQVRNEAYRLVLRAIGGVSIQAYMRDQAQRQDLLVFLLQCPTVDAAIHLAEFASRGPESDAPFLALVQDDVVCYAIATSMFAEESLKESRASVAALSGPLTKVLVAPAARASTAEATPPTGGG